jgi:alkanesulfonate monooxygenase SsuD/methylene tetrahydromethanopterin reductase-like flavin-dependent oxidoreductase (luciferase family)
MTHPFRFGWQAFNAENAADWRDKARRAEALGYSSFMLADVSTAITTRPS